MEKTKRNGFISRAARLALAAALALSTCLPQAAAYADTGSVHISSYEIEGGYAPVNEGVGYRTAEGQVSYCYDHDAHGPGRSGQDYTDLREAAPAEDYLLARGYPATNVIGGTEWSDAEAQAVTQMAVWLASGTASESDFADADPAMVAAARELADEAAAYQGGDASIDGRGTVCTVAGKPAVQSMLTASGGGRIRLAKSSADTNVTEGDGDYSLYLYLSADGKEKVKFELNKDLHITGSPIDLTKKEKEHDGKWYWGVDYYDADGERIIDTYGEPGTSNSVFTTGTLTMSGSPDGTVNIKLENGCVKGTDGKEHTLVVSYSGPMTKA